VHDRERLACIQDQVSGQSNLEIVDRDQGATTNFPVGWYSRPIR